MNLLNEKVVDNAKKKDYNGKKKTYYFILFLKGRDDMTNIKKILATTLSILVVTSGSMATNAMVAVPNVPHQPFMPPIVGVPTVNSGQLSFKSIKTQIANFFSFSSKTDGQLKNTENLYSDESEEIGGQWENRNKEVYDDIQWKFNPKNGTLTVTGTGEIPFMNCFTEDCLPNLWESKKIVDQIKTLVIGEGITKVGDCAFCYLVSLQKVRLPKSVNYIDNHAFYGCTSLTEINLEDSNLTKIGYAALGSCNLSKIKLPSSLKEVGEKVFTGNSNLKEVKFCGTASPAYEKAAFDGCVNLTDVKVPEGYKSGQFCEKSVDRALNENCKIGGSCGENISWELDYDGTLNITGTGEMNSYGLLDSPWSKYRDEITNVIIEDGVESIGSYAFNECNKLAKVRLPEGLKSIGVAAFHDCPIKNLYIPNTVVTIEPSSFYSHESETMELPSCVQTDGLGVLGGLSGKYLKNFTLKSCSNNETPTLKVEDGVLYSADGTELIAYPTAKEDRVFEIPELVKKIHSGAFRGCNNLKKLIIPKSIIIDGGLTFNDASFDLFYCGDSAPEYRIQADRPAFESTNVTVYLSKKYPNTENFCGSSAGKRVLNENCKIGGSCGENLLWELDYDGTLNITGTGEMDSYDEGYGSWNDYKDEITSVIIGDGVESIGSYAFEGCVNLQNVNISESVGQIGSGAFNNCTSLANVNFNGLSDLGCSNAFKDCDKLESVNVPECFENNAFCGKNVSKILDHGSCTEPESSSSMESSQSSSESSGSMESSQSSSKLSSSSISEVNLGSKRIELIFSKEDIQISSVEESIKDIIDLDPGQYKITVKVIDDEEVKVTVQFVNEDDLNEFHKKVSECTK